MQEYLDKRYALAFYELGEERGRVEEYLNELGEVVKSMNDNEQLLLILKHPDLSTYKKKQLFRDIFNGHIDDNVLSFLLIIIEKNRILELDGILQEVKKIHLSRMKVLEAYVKTVVPLSDEERSALTDKLQKKYACTIVLKEEIDKNIIGGVFIRVGNHIMDGTIKSKFEGIRKLTLKTE